MKILLMTSFAGIGFNNAPSIGLYRLKQFVEEVDVECDILDFGLGGYDEALAKAKKGEYQVIGMSVSHYHMKEDFSVIWELKAATSGQKCVFIAGGQEATYNYKNWLIGGIDVVFLGFAERTLAAFCGRIKEDFDGAMADLISFDGIAYREGKQFIFRKSREVTPEEFRCLNYDKVLTLDIPFKPYWGQIREDSEDLNFWTSKFVAENVRLYTTSHCPYRCAFCSSSGFLNFSQQQRTKLLILSAQEVFGLILYYIKKDKAKGFLFSDDEFLLHKNRVRELCDLIIDAKKEGVIDREVMFSCQNRVYDFLVRTDHGVLVEEELIEKMVTAGFHSIGLGVETFVDRLLLSPSMNKKGFNEKDTLLVLEKLIEKGLTPQVNQIVFIPEATREEILYSVRRAIYFVRKGCQVAVTPLMHATAGAPVTETSGYAIKKDQFVNKETGECVEIMEHFIPHDQYLAECSARIWEVFDEEIQIVKEKEGFHMIPKTLVALLMFISVVKLLKDDELICECEKLKHDLINCRKQCA